MSSSLLLHNHPDFHDLLRIVAETRAIDPVLVEKDYWIMHCLYGLQQLGLSFELKGGTSLSKGFGIIDRFSEDIDIRIDPPDHLAVQTGRNHSKPKHIESRQQFYTWLVDTLSIDGITSIARDTAFDDLPQYRSAGIRLYYQSAFSLIEGVKDGILLEVGFDDVTPNIATPISSWAYDYASERVDLVDNRAKAVACYHPGYTLVEKLQTLSTKFRLHQRTATFPPNFLRHYYDVYCLLQDPTVLAFIGTDAYIAHKARRFRKEDNQTIAANEAFLLQDANLRTAYRKHYEATGALYYGEQPDFDALLAKIGEYAHQL